MSLKVFFNTEESNAIRKKFAAEGIFDTKDIALRIRKRITESLEGFHRHGWFYDPASKLYLCNCGRQVVDPKEALQ